MKHIILIVSFAILCSSCEGMFDGIYDEAPADNEFSEGFHGTAAQNQWQLQIDATGYDEWIYINLHNRSTERMPIPTTLSGEWDGQSGLTYQQVEGECYTKLKEVATDPQPEPESWDLAIHHFDVKTNGGKVAIAGTDNFVADIWTDHHVITDLREMMGFRIGYQNSHVNTLLSSWVKMDFSTPPPVYTASGETYILKMSDGTCASLYLRSYISPRGTKGYLTIDIIYPL